MAIQLNAQSRGLGEVVRLERQAFAAKVRIVRAVLGWSQTELGRRAGLTQRAIHKLEQGETEPRRTTVHALEEIWREQHIQFEDLGDGGFQVSIRSTVFEPAPSAQSRRTKISRVGKKQTAKAD
jgi:transcriptional regulator with XRE-family HTH domain